jgi:hypothetical protein
MGSVSPPPATTLELIGAYRVSVSPETVTASVTRRYPAEHFTRFERAAGERQIKAEVTCAVLCEFRVDAWSHDFSVDTFGQPWTDQAPYDEHYLSADGSTLIAQGDPPVTPDGPFRVAFFLHFYRRWLPIRTPAGLRWGPRILPMPKRLAEIVSYEPVD